MSFIIMKMKAVIMNKEFAKSLCCSTFWIISKGSFWFELYIHFYIKPVLQYLSSPREASNFTSPHFYHKQQFLWKRTVCPEVHLNLFPEPETSSGGNLMGQSRPVLTQCWLILCCYHTAPPQCASRSCNDANLPEWTRGTLINQWTNSVFTDTHETVQRDRGRGRL